MTQKSKRTGRAMSIPGGLAYGEMFALGFTVLLSGILAFFLEKGMVHLENSGYGVMIILLLCPFLAGIISARKIQHQILLVCLGSGILYFLLLLALTALFFGGQYEAIPETMLLIAAGSAAAAGISLRKSRSRKSRRT